MFTCICCAFFELEGHCTLHTNLHETFCLKDIATAPGLPNDLNLTYRTPTMAENIAFEALASSQNLCAAPHIPALMLTPSQ